jgi:hypothetical protein
MPVVSGGWTTDADYVDQLDSSGMINTIFKERVIYAIKKKILDVESASGLSAAEKSLQDSSDYSIGRVLILIKREAKYVSRGVYMPGSDVDVCVNNQWTNILKKWVV